METEIITAVASAGEGGLEGIILALLVALVAGLAKQLLDGHRRDKRERNGHAPATKEDIQGMRGDMRAIKEAVEKTGDELRRGDAELHARIDRVEAAAKEDRQRIGAAEGDIKVLNDRSKSGRCTGGDKQ